MEKREFVKGQVIDILDINDVYCPATIQSISADKTKLSVTYIGWSQEWDETVEATSDRIMIDKKTIMVKSWVKINPKLLFWPCKIFIRYTLKDSEKGEAYLRSERRVFLIPYGPEFARIKPYMHGVWMTTANILVYESKSYGLRISEGEASAHSAQFKEAVRQCEGDPDAKLYRFKFEGSLDIEEKRQEIRNLMLQKKLQEKEEKLLRQQQYKAMYTSGGEYGRRGRIAGDDSYGAGAKKQKISSRLGKDTLSLPVWSKYFIPYSMFKSTLHGLHPAGAESIQNVVRVLEAQKQLKSHSQSETRSTSKRSERGDPNGSDILSKLGSSGSHISEHFPFKISSLCASMDPPASANYSTSATSRGKGPSSTNQSSSSSSSSGVVKKAKGKGSSNGVKSFRVNPRKSSHPRHIEIKRTSTYLSMNRMKQGHSSSGAYSSNIRNRLI